MQKNLTSTEAREKFKELVSDIKVCMFITNNEGDTNTHTRPMWTVDTEDDGTLWFFTNRNSIKVDEVAAEQKAHLTYAHPGKESYLDVWGMATVHTDRALIKEKWQPMLKAWFPKGDDDPDIALLRIRPTSCHYWDAESGKMIEFFKMAIAAVTGKPQIAEGAEGKLSL